MRSKSDARPLRGPARLAQMAAADPGAPGCRGRWGLGLREAFAALVPAAISDSAGAPIPGTKRQRGLCNVQLWSASCGRSNARFTACFNRLRRGMRGRGTPSC